MPLTCEDVRTRQPELVLGIVSDEASLIEHVNQCPRCQQQFDEFTSGEEWQQLGDVLRAGGDYDSPTQSDVSNHSDASNPSRDGDASNKSQPVDFANRPTIANTDAFLSYLSPTDDPSSLGRIGNMEVYGVIGHGGAGIVYKAHDAALGRNVAIKLLNPALADQESARTRFAREARAMAAITHEHIVPVYAVDEHNEVPYLVMEYVPGGTLAQRLERGPLDVVETVRVGLQIARGLAAAHRLGVVHRDVKPSNILLDPGVERVRVADFGLARAFSDQTQTESGTLLGTPQFMSPEQVRGEAVDGRSDLFSLGSVLFNCVTGRLPFEASSIYAAMQKISADSAPSARDVNPEVPQWLDALIRQLHAREPNRRIDSSEALEQILEQELSYLQQPAETRELPRRKWIVEPPRGYGRIWKSVAGLMLAAAIVFAWFNPLQQTETSPPQDDVVLVAPAPPKNIKPELQKYVDRLTQVNGPRAHNVIAFQVGPEILKLPSEDSLVVAQAAWPKISNYGARRGLLKAYHFGQHPNALTVLHLGMTDQHEEVRETAEYYLRMFTMRSFQDDNAGYKAWIEKNEKRPLKEVFLEGFDRLAGQLERVDLEVGLKVLDENTIDLGGGGRNSSRRELAEAAGESRIKEVILGWCKRSIDDSRQASDLGGYLKQLPLSEQEIDEVVRPILKSDAMMGLKRGAVGALARKFPNEARLLLEQWVADFVPHREDALRKLDANLAIWELARIGDPRSIPKLIAILDSDNSKPVASVINGGLTRAELGKITGVELKSYHDGPWWRNWWKENRDRLPESVRSMEVPVLPKTEFGKTYKSTSAEMATHEGRMRIFRVKFEEFATSENDSALWTQAMDLASVADPRSIPVLIGAIDADNSYGTVYGLGYYALGFGKMRDLTGVKYSPYHDGAWWRRWWNDNKHRFPEAADIAIPEFPKTAHGKAYKPFPSDLDTHEGRVHFLRSQLKDPDVDLSDLAGLFTDFGDPRGIPILIGLIASDETGKANYDVGYFGLCSDQYAKLTRVQYKKSMDALWWRAWWATHRDDFPTAKHIDIPTFEIARKVEDPSSDVADIPNKEIQIGDDANKRYFLIGDHDTPPAGGYKLAIVMPGGDGGRGFNPFVRRIYKHTLGPSWIVAEPIAFQWTPAQQIVWPKKGDDVDGAAFTTEDFIDSILDDIKKRTKINDQHIVTLSWSSSGPAAYALALRPDSPITGSYIAMSVYKEDFYQTAAAAKDRRFVIDHSPDDGLCPFWMSEDAEKTLKENGGDVKRLSYKGGHGWRGDVYGRISEGMEWLVRD
ncbi:MAG: protein kinase [Planctomycetota bacterium]